MLKRASSEDRPEATKRSNTSSTASCDLSHDGQPGIAAEDGGPDAAAVAMEGACDAMEGVEQGGGGGDAESAEQRCCDAAGEIVVLHKAFSIPFLSVGVGCRVGRWGEMTDERVLGDASDKYARRTVCSLSSLFGGGVPPFVVFHRRTPLVLFGDVRKPERTAVSGSGTDCSPHFFWTPNKEQLPFPPL